MRSDLSIQTAKYSQMFLPRSLIKIEHWREPPWQGGEWVNNDLRSFSVNIFYVAYAAFCTIMVISQQKEARSRDYVFYCRMT